MQWFFLLYNLFVIEVFLLITSIDRTNYQRIYLSEGKQSIGEMRDTPLFVRCSGDFTLLHLCLWNLLPDKLLSIELDFRV